MHMGQETINMTLEDPHGFAGDLLVCFVEEDALTLDSEILGGVNRALPRIKEIGDFNGKKDQTFIYYPTLISDDQEPIPRAKRVLLVGLGKQDDEINDRRERLRMAGGTIARQAEGVKARDLLVVLPREYSLDAAEIAQCLVEGLLLGNYRFHMYKTTLKEEEKAARMENIALHPGGLVEEAVHKGMIAGKIGSEAVCAARDMANRPGNGWTPHDFAEYAKKISKKSGLKYKVLEKSALQKLGMGGILAVNQGSAQPPKLVIVEYRVSKKLPTVLLVGKGLTFDSGGISAKPPAGMESMKYDMSGGAAVLAAMQAIAGSRISGINVVALIPATENMPGPEALKPGDIITQYGGKTVEIINTDAEGRLIMADALGYGIATYQPEAVIDLATLTGAVIVALGHHYTGLLANNDQLAAQLTEAGVQAGEPLWRLPLGPEYRKLLDSRVADLKNTGDKSAGTITAACYLQEFVGDTPWAHLDIAGTAWDFTEKSYIPKGPSGIGVRTLVGLLNNWQPLNLSAAQQ
ncbi:leucyl aminopeptidase [Desulfobulbus alkaliphilus]|uniref:leucyl aminopeptidase n=1 Tax=Desulfobulbus alkaliphilus TaxID=869814 RepID=UPI001962FD5E|nr:leucyl aminopeptidase [Desulfobulbus alkaliphilus]MBM9537942.1 leucyl aminopeptidase [Desulfobulbus alkaliphilus]